jgi:CARDB
MINVIKNGLMVLTAVFAVAFTGSAVAQPNLTPYQPSGWSDKIVVSKVTGTTTDSSGLQPGDTLYVDWAVVNFGSSPSGNFTVALYVDGGFKKQWSLGSLNGFTYTTPVTDYQLGGLPNGVHTLQIVMDSGNIVAESDESDNTYTKTITVGTISVPAPTIVAPTIGATGLSTTPSFTWTPASNATGYRIMVATSAADLPTAPNASTGGPSLVINTTSATTNYSPVMPINPGTTYYWQVHGMVGNADVGTWSSVNSFTTAAGPTGGLTIIPVFDSSITTDPKSMAIQSTINAAIAVYASKFATPVTVTINFQTMLGGLGSSSSYYQTQPYSNFRTALASHATSPDDTAALAHIPAGSSNPVNGNSSIDVNLPLLRALGFNNNVSPPPGDPDGFVYLNISSMNVSGAETDPTKYALFAVVSHEIDEVLGCGSALNQLNNGDPAPTGPISPEDLFRYDQSGLRSFTTDSNAVSYFSLDGSTHLARFNQLQDEDFQDWYSPGGQTPQVQDAVGTRGATPVLGVELRLLDVLGYTRAFPIVASAGSGGTISPSGSISKAAASSQQFTATPNANYIVNQWLVDGSPVQSGGTTYTLSNIQTNHDVQVTFTAQASKTNQTINFAALVNRNYGDAAFTVSATASSGLPVTFSIVSGPATISGSTVTITGTGTVTVRASQAGNANYNPAPDVDQSFTVAKANQTISFGSLMGKTYGDSAFSVSATASSTLAVSFSIVSGPATISGNTVTITGAGTVTVRASQAGNANYNAAPNVDQTFTVAKANQTIAFSPLSSKALGEPAFAVNATASSGLTVSFGIFSGPATISGNTVTFTNAGTVVVRASQAGNANYSAAPNVDQSFTVYAAPSLNLTNAGPNVVLSWPTNVAGFNLESATNLTPPVAWSPVLPAPVIANTRYVVTNAAPSTLKLYRLRK